MEKNDTHTKILGRTSELDASGMMNKGIRSIMATSKSTITESTAGGEDSETQAGEVEEEIELDDEDLMGDDH